MNNPATGPETEPGDRIRTRITSSDQSLDFEEFESLMGSLGTFAEAAGRVLEG